MVKIIKCPTCGSPIQISPQSVGQVIKCPGCGKGIKLVAKKSASSASGASSAIRSPSNVLRNTASMSGSMNETYRSIMGEPVMQDGPPAINGGCARCGKRVDEADLVNDDGQLVCKECAVAAAADRDAGEEAIDYAPRAYVPTLRGKIINFTPMFFVFCFFALVWGGTQIYLSMVPPPKRTKVTAEGSVVETPHLPTLAPATVPAEASTVPSELAVPQPTEGAATQPSPENISAVEDEWEKQNKESIESRLREAKQLASNGSRQKAIRMYDEVLALVGTRTFRDAELSEQYAFAVSERHRLQEAETQPVELPQPATAPEAVAVTEPSTSPSLPQDPVLLALLRLKERDYVAAHKLLDNIRAHAVDANSLDSTPRLATILDGIAAASIGMGMPELGKSAADLAYKRGFQSRSLILNRAMIHLSVPTNARDIYETSLTIRNLMNSKPDDDLASTLYGMCVERMEGMVLRTLDDRTKVREARGYLDSYNDHLAQLHPGEMKWGCQWLPADDVKRYRLLRGSPAEKAAIMLTRQLAVAKARANVLASQIEQGHHANLDVSHFQSQLDHTNTQIEKLKAQAEATKHSYYPPQWPEKFEPVFPDDN